MISVLIPIYNYNAFPLAAEIHRQCTACHIAFEIICFDDGSSFYMEDNIKISDLPFCKVEYLKDNVGRSEIRNRLVNHAKHAHILCIDGDSIITNETFIKTYIEHMDESDMIYGGRIHPEKAPSNRNILRWKYGKYIEDTGVEERIKKPYESLLFNNTLIRKGSFERIKFDNNIKRYGHEDTLSAYKAKQLEYKIKHIHNPVKHGDIDNNEVYINKTKEALENLKLLYRDHSIDPAFIKLLRVYNMAKKFRIHALLAFFYSMFRALMYRNLTSKHASLFIFNVYKLSYFSYINQKK